MSFSNLDYLYDHLPGRFRRDDTDLLLKRFLQHFGEKLDSYDAAYDAFHASITPATATAEFVAFWLEALFGWSWFPRWFTLADKRRVYGNFARHLARRGTRVGIEKFLRDFGIVAQVFTRSQPWGDFFWGETSFGIDRPLHLIIDILRIVQPAADLCCVGEAVWGEGFYARPVRAFTDKEIVDLVRYQQPLAQQISVVRKLGSGRPSEEIVWEQIQW